MSGLHPGTDGLVKLYKYTLTDKSDVIEIDKAMASEISSWKVGGKWEENMLTLSFEKPNKVFQALKKTRLVRIVQMCRKYEVFFSKDISIEHTWPFLMMAKKINKYSLCLTDPITGNRLQWPAKFSSCTHLECFEYSTAENLLFCPFCNAPAKEPVLEKTLKVVLDLVKDSATKITLYSGFYWNVEVHDKNEPIAFYKGAFQQNPFMANTLYAP
jgi:hypothetical protein